MEYEHQIFPIKCERTENTVLVAVPISKGNKLYPFNQEDYMIKCLHFIQAGCPMPQENEGVNMTRGLCSYKSELFRKLDELPDSQLAFEVKMDSKKVEADWEKERLTLPPCIQTYCFGLASYMVVNRGDKK